SGGAGAQCRGRGARERMTGSGWLRAAIVAVFLACSLWGLERDLPYTPEVDEPSFVVPAGRIAATGDLNPHWFGHPGSTVICPLLFAHAQLVRTDTACFFFALLALAACLRLLDDASPGRQLLAGAAVGLAIATKYSLAALLPVLLVADMLTLRSTRRRDDGWLGVALGLL